jgi:hypothetical protein
MTALINRVLLAIRILFGARVLVLEKRLDNKKNKDKITLWGSIDDRAEQVHTLGKMADSIYAELSPKELEKLHTLQRPNK